MKQPRGAAGGDLILFIFFIIVLGIVWGLTGGPGRDISRSGPFLNPPFPLGDGSAYTVPGVNIPSSSDVRGQGSGSGSNVGGTGEDDNSLSGIISRIRGTFGSGSGGDSPYAGLVTISRGNTRSSEPDEEYIEIKTSRNVEGRITISDWRIESSVTLLGTTIGDASYLPRAGQVNSESPVALSPNTTVYLVTGRSPIGSSFRVNICSGYFTQSQDFDPNIREECPTPEDELKNVVGIDFIPNDECVDYVEDIRRCEITLTSVPGIVGSACRDFIFDDLTYNGCVDLHRNESTFYKNEWRIYLDRDQELWKNSREKIQLLDENGLVVDVLSY